MVSIKTIEEKIDQLIESKKAITQELLPYDDKNLIKELRREEWIELFKAMESYHHE